jgi:hypothetical protein
MIFTKLLFSKITLVFLCCEFGVEFEVFEEVALRGMASDFHDGFDDCQKTQFGGWPWFRCNYVNVALEEHLAKHVDGSMEKTNVQVEKENVLFYFSSLYTSYIILAFRFND